MSALALVDVLLAQLEDDPQALEALAAKLRPLLVDVGGERVANGWLTTKQAAEYVGLSANAIRKHTAERTIPFEQDVPAGKCWFLRSELDAWRRGQFQPTFPKGIMQRAARLRELGEQ